MSQADMQLELSLEVDPGLVSVTRRFIEETIERVVPNADSVFRVAMAAHELLENAAKYAVGRRARLRLIIDRGSDGPRATVTLTNRTASPHRERLVEAFREMNASEDAFAHYFALMHRNAPQADISGLGLARIRAEGEMSLALEHVGDEVTIIATARLTDAAPAVAA